jgi:hypothetical protein
MQISPLDEVQYKREKKQVFNSRILRVSGRGSDMVVLNAWLTMLEAQPWVAELQDQQYKADADEQHRVHGGFPAESGTFSFTLWLQ